MSKTTKPRYVGSSSDGRTNRWEVECPSCKKKFMPLTTLLAKQALDCPHCESAMLADYNKEVVYSD